MNTRFALLCSSALAMVAAPDRARAQSDDDCTHVVAAGDTLERIANRHGVRPELLIEGNAELKKNPDLIRIGQRIDVCAARRAERSGSNGGRRKCGSGGVIVEHEVGNGDTLGRIATKYGVGESDILRRNAALKANPNLLRVPGAELPHVQYANVRQRGYVRCDLDDARFVARYQMAADVLSPTAPVTTATTWTVTAGTVGAES